MHAGRCCELFTERSTDGEQGARPVPSGTAPGHGCYARINRYDRRRPHSDQDRSSRSVY